MVSFSRRENAANECHGQSNPTQRKQVCETPASHLFVISEGERKRGKKRGKGGGGEMRGGQARGQRHAAVSLVNGSAFSSIRKERKGGGKGKGRKKKRREEEERWKEYSVQRISCFVNPGQLVQQPLHGSHYWREKKKGEEGKEKRRRGKRKKGGRRRREDRRICSQPLSVISKSRGEEEKRGAGGAKEA